MELTFEKAIEELESVTKKLENGDAALEESLKLFERGVFLTGFCTKALDEAALRISVLVSDKEGNITAKEFEPKEV